MRFLLSAAWLAAGILAAADLEVTVEIPRLNVAEYHRPYVAVWMEDAGQKVAANLTVWYDQQTTKNEKGTTWLKDLRTWWRKAGRELSFPVDGVSGATRPPGSHQLTFRGAGPALSKLAPGAYELVVEAAREVGGREVLRVPFQWPGGKAQPAKAQGQRELGLVQLIVKP
ncbi:MAG: DUF2271 domain-containing protein [Bryobacteraceae bacterium]|nr:DUF2271 domain-containing protein [Bryobacteraceae bacterium]